MGGGGEGGGGRGEGGAGGGGEGGGGLGGGWGGGEGGGEGGKWARLPQSLQSVPYGHELPTEGTPPPDPSPPSWQMPCEREASERVVSVRGRW